MDIEKLRGETPGCSARAHLNNAGAALMPAPVLAAVKAQLDLEAEIGGYEAADARASEIDGAYAAVADLLSTRPENVAFVEHATAAYVQALSSIPLAAGDVILTTRHDYNSNQIQFMSLEKRLGIRVVRAPDCEEGGVDLAEMDRRIRKLRPRLVSVSWIPTNSGLVQPAAEIGRICREEEVPYLVDACQAVGQMPIDVDAVGCDFLSATSRKFLRGPRGAGFLFVSDRVLKAGLTPLFVDIRGADWTDPDRFRPHATARRFETWEYSWGLILGTGVAARYATQVGLEAIRDRARALAGRVRDRAAQIPGVRVLDRGREQCAIVTLHKEGASPDAIRTILRERKINCNFVWRGAAVLDFDEKGVPWALRVSPHYYNTEEEIDRLIEALG